MSAGQLAFATVRAHAARGRLVGDEALLRLRLAPDASHRAPTLVQLGLGDGSAAGAFRELFARLVDDYGRALRSTPGDPAPLWALLGRHEAENLKLVFRACVHSLPPARWTRWWRPLGGLAQLDPARWQAVRTLPELLEAAAHTPYRVAVEDLVRAREPAMGELLVDRFVTERIRQAAPPDEPVLQTLLLTVVRERDDELRRRGAAWGLDEQACARLAVLEPKRHATPEELRQARRQACRRAFLDGALSRAPWVALLLVEEERLAQLIALAEAG